MNKLDKTFITIGEYTVSGVALLILGLSFIHPVGWAILILGVCKMFGVI